MYSICMQDRETWTTGSLVWHLGLRWRAGVDRAIAHLGGLTHAQYSVLASLHGLVSAGGESRVSENSQCTQDCSESTYPSSCERWRRAGLLSVNAIVAMREPFASISVTRQTSHRAR